MPGTFPRAFPASLLITGRWCFAGSISEVRTQGLGVGRAKVAQGTKLIAATERSCPSAGALFSSHLKVAIPPSNVEKDRRVMQRH